MIEIQQILQDQKLSNEAKRLALLYRDVESEDLKLALNNKDLVPHVLTHKMASSNFLDSIVTPDDPELVLQILNHRPDYLNNDRFCSLFTNHFNNIDINPQSADVLRVMIDSDYFNQNKPTLLPTLKGMLSSPLGISLGLSQQDPMQGSNQGLKPVEFDNNAYQTALSSFLSNS